MGAFLRDGLGRPIRNGTFIGNFKGLLEGRLDSRIEGCGFVGGHVGDISCWVGVPWGCVRFSDVG